MFTGRPKPIRISSVRISGVYCIKMYQHILIIELGRRLGKYKWKLHYAIRSVCRDLCTTFAHNVYIVGP